MSEAALPASSRLPQVRRLLLWLLVAGLVCFFAYFAQRHARFYYDYISDTHDSQRALMFDFGLFYAASSLMVSDEREHAYDHDTQKLAFARAGGRPLSDDHWFYNPPLFPLILSPLTLMNIPDAYLVSVGINIALAALLCLLIGTILKWRQPQTLLLLLALIASQPVYRVIHQG